MSTSEQALPAPQTNKISNFARYIGYVKGFPWLMVVPVTGSLLWSRITNDKRGVDNSLALFKMMFKGADLYTSLIWYLRGFYSISDPYVPAKYFKVEDRKAVATKEASIDLDGLELQYGVNDFDAPDRPMNSTFRLLYWMMRNAPEMQSSHMPMPSIDKYKAMLSEVFKSTFVAYRPLDTDPDDPATVCAYFTSDFGAPWLERKGDRYVVDLSHWESAELKCGGTIYENYGGYLEFDESHQDVSITVQGIRYTPSDTGWGRARYILMSTALISVVLEQHTLQIHYLNSALFSLKARTHLTVNHPIYRFLRPFTLRSVMINEHAVHSILTESGLLFHGTALSWPAMVDLYKHAAKEYRHVPVPEVLRVKGLLDENSEQPSSPVVFAEESLKLYSIIERFVTGYIDLYYSDDMSVQSDRTLSEFYQEIRKGQPDTSGIPEQLSKKSLVDLLAVYIWNVTFWHDYTSQTGNSLSDYRLGAVLIKKEEVFGSYYPNIQEFLVTLLAHQLTTVEGNKVVDNFHHFWLNDAALDIALKFQQELWDYKDGLSKRNVDREIIFNAYDPTEIESSVLT